MIPGPPQSHAFYFISAASTNADSAARAIAFLSLSTAMIVASGTIFVQPSGDRRFIDPKQGPPALTSSSDRRRVSLMVDYLFGRGVSRALPKSGYRLYFSRRSGRVKLVHHDGKLLATVKPSGAMALSIYGATVLSRTPRFRENCIQVSDDATAFVKGGKSVFCKFVTRAGRNIQPKSEVAVVDSTGRVLGVGMAVLSGKVMRQFKHGVAVKVRAGIPA